MSDLPERVVAAFEHANKLEEALLSQFEEERSESAVAAIGNATRQGAVRNALVEIAKDIEEIKQSLGI